ncbi:DUF6884 domain-containing protein [Sphingosinicella terrae]|uniref:DUF6884 domain-containing protein n=1 Tax=Sphingosinicella terrae TaxID=2172047 RepID=UPI0013B44B1B|nr:DUF6884 domain-containing protein [Sphingosinicella terrae]
MTRIAFVACSKTKAKEVMPAAALYTSPLFKKSLLAALDLADKVYILSAEHGLLDLGEPVSPYDTTLKTMRRDERLAWGTRTSVRRVRPLCSTMSPIRTVARSLKATSSS